jgi:hypothetical protein
MRMLHDGTLSAVDMNLLVVLRALLAGATSRAPPRAWA